MATNNFHENARYTAMNGFFESENGWPMQVSGADPPSYVKYLMAFVSKLSDVFEYKNIILDRMKTAASGVIVNYAEDGSVMKSQALDSGPITIDEIVRRNQKGLPLPTNEEIRSRAHSKPAPVEDNTPQGPSLPQAAAEREKRLRAANKGSWTPGMFLSEWWDMTPFGVKGVKSGSTATSADYIRTNIIVIVVALILLAIAANQLLGAKK